MEERLRADDAAMRKDIVDLREEVVQNRGRLVRLETIVDDMRK